MTGREAVSTILAIITSLVLMLLCVGETSPWQISLLIYSYVLFCTAVIMFLSGAEVEIDLLRDYFNRGGK